MNKRILSGIQPSGVIHFGNYLGAIRHWVKLSGEYDAFFCIVDLHAITIKQDPKILHEKTRELAKLYIAAGIDPKRSTIFIQSHVPAHTELAWILNTIAKVSELERMTQFKDKAGRNRSNINVGLLAYPVLQAADILLYQPHVVPVGEDQRQHLELTRTLAKRFNSEFTKTFRVPDAYIPKSGARIMALDDPTSKMSKSAASPANYIALLDNPKTIRKKIMRAVTDSGSEVKASPQKPAVTNLLNIYHLISGTPIAELEKTYTGKGYGEFKSDLADVIVQFLEPLQKEYHNISDADIEAILSAGADHARTIAQQTLRDAKDAMGLG